MPQVYHRACDKALVGWKVTFVRRSVVPQSFVSQSFVPQSLKADWWSISFPSLLLMLALAFPSSAFGRMSASLGCPTVTPATAVESPKETRSHNGRLKVRLLLRNSLDAAGRMQYCYLDEHGDRSPTLRVRPGDLLILKLTNAISQASAVRFAQLQTNCGHSAMTSEDTNLHFHGLAIPPLCHEDDSLRTSIPPSHKDFVYRFRIPKNQPPGLYWYHPHIHGNSEQQVLGGASGAIIVEGIERSTPSVAGLPERVLVIRDQKLEVSASSSNHDPSRPAKDLSLNFTPVPYPQYPVGTISTAPRRREFWRVLNASADTYVNLAVLFNGEWQESGLTATHGSWQSLGLVSVDGVPISDAGSSAKQILWQTEIPIPPGGRAEFIFQTPPAGTKAELFTAGAVTNPPEEEDTQPSAVKELASSIPDKDDYTPPRPLARIVASESAVEPAALPDPPTLANSIKPALASLSPVHERKLYFSEKVRDPKHPETSTVFYLTEEGRTPKAFDPSISNPDIVVHLGDVEDWIIENRSGESHAFHIHQLHFLVLSRDEVSLEQSYLADTVDVPYWDGISTRFPSVRLRMDFRNPEIVGTFPYHCHILQHADGGMMGLIRVLPDRATEEQERKP